MAGSGGIQTSVNDQPAPAVAGDFANTNPRYSADFGPGGAVSGPSGLTVGRAAWAVNPDDANGAPATLNSFGAGPIAGIVPREQQALITTFLADSSMVIPAGFMATVMSAADLWVVNDGSGQALPGQKAYATFANGKFTFGAAATPTTGAVATGIIAATTSSVTGSITDDVLTVTVVGSGTVYPGTTISGTNVVSGTKVVSQLSGTAGGVGTYAVSIPEQTVASTTISGTYGLFTAVSGLTGTFHVGDTLHGTGGGGVTAGTKITALGTGTGGLGTYIVDPTQTVTSTAIDVTAINVETSWYARSSALAGELVKISNLPGIG